MYETYFYFELEITKRKRKMIVTENTKTGKLSFMYKDKEFFVHKASFEAMYEEYKKHN